MICGYFVTQWVFVHILSMRIVDLYLIFWIQAWQDENISVLKVGSWAWTSFCRINICWYKAELLITLFQQDLETNWLTVEWIVTITNLLPSPTHWSTFSMLHDIQTADETMAVGNNSEQTYLKNRLVNIRQKETVNVSYFPAKSSETTLS